MNLTAPEEVGFSSARLSRIQPTMQKYIDDEKLAGIVTLIARHGQVIHLEKVGMQNKETDNLLSFDTLFRIYSMTKPITSVALMMLHEQARFHLADPVSTYLPAFEQVKVYEYGKLVDPVRPMTIHDLLTHTSGLVYGWGDAPVDKLYQDAELLAPNVSSTEFIQRLAQLPLKFHPGMVWSYSVSTDLVGYLVEVIADMPFWDYLQENIFSPLGMNDTSFSVPAGKIDRLATNYGPCETNKIKAIDLPEESQYAKPMVRQSGGGGLISTMADYYRFAQLVLNRGELDGVRLLGPKTVELMTQNHLPSYMFPLAIGDPMPGIGFGLGFSVITDLPLTRMAGSPGNYGWGGAANTQFWIDPVEDLLAIIMLQYMPSGTYPVVSDFQSLVYQAVIS
ncbi:MAG: serine hydrolase domain-containing protein [Chloroflexota bacterium]